MLGSLDCMHWEWEGCPVSYHGQYTWGVKSHPTIILEAVASQDLWFWHAMFGTPGACNDLNVLDRSDLFDDVCNGSAPTCPFIVNGAQYDHGYYLADDIYPEWAVFVKTLTYPNDPRRERYKAFQERARTDIKRAFCALKKRWHIIAVPARTRIESRVGACMITCIILHNMILEHEGHAICTYVESENVTPSVPPILPGSDASIGIRMKLRNREKHHDLRNDLAEHLWRVNHIDPNEEPEDNTENFVD